MDGQSCIGSVAIIKMLTAAPHCGGGAPPHCTSSKDIRNASSTWASSDRVSLNCPTAELDNINRPTDTSSNELSVLYCTNTVPLEHTSLTFTR